MWKRKLVLHVYSNKQIKRVSDIGISYDSETSVNVKRFLIFFILELKPLQMVPAKEVK